MSQPLKSTVPKTATLKIATGKYAGKQFRLLGRRILIGTSENCDVILKNNPECSPEHALLLRISRLEYSIESRDKKNPVFINRKACTSQKLKAGDEVVIGDTLFHFGYVRLNKPQNSPITEKKKGKAKPLQWAMIGLCLVLAATQFFKDDSSGEQAKSGATGLSVKQQTEMQDEVEVIRKLAEEEAVVKKVSGHRKESMKFFVNGFRDFNKGYYYRAKQIFSHCATIDPTNKICKSYQFKSQLKLDRIVQKNMLLGKNYQEKGLYKLCAHIYKSVQIAIPEPKNLIHQSAKQNRLFCKSQLTNKF